MSSIFGMIQFNQKPLDQATLQTMQQTLNHWNADDKGLWQNDSVGLGQLMFWNTPESLKEKLPLHNSESSCTITADARIDNREELFEKLSIDYSLRKEIPDSSLILKAYEKYGEDCVKHLIGDFAFAVWDEKNQQLFCGRDQIGVKPFFYYKDENIFAFASEIKGILCLNEVDKSLNKQYFYNQVFNHPQQATNETIYKNIHRIHPAHCLTIKSENKKINTWQYWDLDVVTETKYQNEDDYYEGLLYHFNDAIKCRIRSAFPIGAELSGGFDSSTVVGAAQHFMKEDNRKLITFSNTLPEGITDERILELDERKYIDAVIKYNGIKDYRYINERIFSDPLEEVDFTLMMNDGLEPWHPHWQFPIKNAASLNGTKTLLTGFGGDELVSYYGHFGFLDYLDKKEYIKYFKAPSTIFDEQFNRLIPFIPYPIAYGLHKFKNIIGFNNQELRKISKRFHVPLKYRFKKNDTAWKDPYFRESYTSFRHFQRARLMRPNTAFRVENETRHGYYFNTETRYPMTDIRLNQFYLSLPNSFKYGSNPRSFFKKTFQRYLPDEILSRGPKESGSLAPYLSINFEQWKEKWDSRFFETLNITKLEPRLNQYISPKSGNSNANVNLYLLRWIEQNM